MSMAFGFCASCGAPRASADQRFCPTCGAALPAVPTPPAEPVQPAAAPFATPFATPLAQPPAEAVASTFGAPPVGAAGTQYSTPAPEAPPTQYPAQFSPPPAGPSGAPPWAVQPPYNGGAATPPPYWPQPQPTPAGRNRMPLILGLIAVVLVAIVAAAGVMLAAQGPKASPKPTQPVAVASKSSADATAGADLSTEPGTSAAVGPAESTGSGPDLSGAVTALSDITSYRFSMTLVGGDFSSALSALGGTSSGDQPLTMSGTIVVSPQAAADFTIVGIHMIEIDGYDYVDMGTGSYFKTPATGTSLSDEMSPSTMFADMMDPSLATDLRLVGTETKNGTAALHYVASDAALAEFGSESGVEGATWSCDIWLANQGGYPVSMSIVGTSGGATVYQITFELTNVNDPANVVNVPTNVTGS